MGSLIAEKILSHKDRAIDFPEDQNFSEKFQVQGASESEVRNFFDHHLRYDLLRFADPLLKIEGHRDTLLFTKGELILSQAAPRSSNKPLRFAHCFQTARNVQNRVAPQLKPKMHRGRMGQSSAEQALAVYSAEPVGNHRTKT